MINRSKRIAYLNSKALFGLLTITIIFLAGCIAAPPPGSLEAIKREAHRAAFTDCMGALYQRDIECGRHHGYNCKIFYGVDRSVICGAYAREQSR